MSKNNRCSCGHIAQEHENRGQRGLSTLQPICWKCYAISTTEWIVVFDYSKKDYYHEFKIDNLKYLESLND